MPLEGVSQMPVCLPKLFSPVMVVKSSPTLAVDQCHPLSGQNCWAFAGCQIMI